MFANLENEHQQFLNDFESFARSYFNTQKNKDFDFNVIWDSMFYSFSNGGKRFRPFLIYLISKTQTKNFDLFYSWAVAIEMIHTYSLIHDDLPCMDNDDFRRGQPTNHKKFGEDIALLAGDSLQTEAFALISADPNLTDSIKIKLIQILSKNIGVQGMVGGQVLDMKSDKQTSLEGLEKIHRLKTGCLIQAAVLGAVEIAQVTAEQKTIYNKLGADLGLAFQIKDDLLDGLDNAQDHKSYLSKMGSTATQELLNKMTNSLLVECEKLPQSGDYLKKIILFNLNRNK